MDNLEYFRSLAEYCTESVLISNYKFTLNDWVLLRTLINEDVTLNFDEWEIEQPFIKRRTVQGSGAGKISYRNRLLGIFSSIFIFNVSSNL